MAAQWRAQREAMRGEEREQLRELVTTVVQVPGEGEPRVTKRDIPETLGDMVKKAGQDNNHLQKVVNVHESAFTWVRRYKTSNSASERRRLRELLLLGTSAVFTTVLCLQRYHLARGWWGTRPMHSVSVSNPGCPHCCARGTARQRMSSCSR